MATKTALKEEIHEILKNADLTVMSAKKVRLQLEKKLKCDLLERKNEIDKIVMDFVNDQEVESESETESKWRPNTLWHEGSNQNSDDEEEQESSRTRAVPKRVYTEAGSSDEEVRRTRKSASGARGAKRSHKKAGNADDKDGKPKAKRATGKGNGFTRPCQLSPELANLMGADALPRHEVVKKMWSMIKERNLYDPKNKQYALCDDDLIKVMGVKRFRTFGMLKYLKRHFKQNI